MGPIAGQKVEWSQKPKKYAVTCFSRASDPVAAGLGASIGWCQAPTNAKIRNRCFPGHPRPISPRVSPWRYEANARHVMSIPLCLPSSDPKLFGRALRWSSQLATWLRTLDTLVGHPDSRKNSAFSHVEPTKMRLQCNRNGDITNSFHGLLGLEAGLWSSH